MNGGNYMTKSKRILKKGAALLLCVMLIVPIALSAVSADAITYNVTSSYTSGKYYRALTAVNLTGNNRTDIVNIARSQNGYLEGNSDDQLSGEVTTGGNNYTEYGRWYGLQDMWCAMFVSWCAYNAGVATSIVPKTASTVTALNYFINQGVAHTRASVAAGSYTPIAGDIIFFKSGRNSAITNHIGIVTGYSGTTVSTIEGNTSSATVSTNGGCVRAKSYDISNTYIVYICRPKYPSDSAAVSTVEFDNKYDYRYWPNADSRWANTVTGAGSATVAKSSGITTAIVKLAIQAGLKDAAEYDVNDFVTYMNANSGYTSAGAIYWDPAKTAAGFTSVNSSLLSDGTYTFAEKKSAIIDWIKAGKHLALYVENSSGAKSWVAVDEAKTLASGEIYIMDATSTLKNNAEVTADSKYASLKRIACFEGGSVAYQHIGADDYRLWDKADSRWSSTNIGGNYTVSSKGELIIAATKLAIQAGLKNSSLYNVNSAIEDTKKGANGGFSDAGNMYWADAAQALGFSGYNANLKASGPYSSTECYSEIVGYINEGKHMVIKVGDNWYAVDEGKTKANNGHIWIWRATSGAQHGDNSYSLDSISANFNRVACFTGGSIKSTEDHYVYAAGGFNGWSKNSPMTKISDGVYQSTFYIPAGTYTGANGFKIVSDGYYYGNNGTITNKTDTDWVFEGADNNCGFTASGGTYTFTYTVSTRKLFVKYNSETVVLAGTFIDDWATDIPLTINNEGVYEKTIQLDSGSYYFKVKENTTYYGNSGTIDDTTAATSATGWDFTTDGGNCTLNATGGYYTFIFSTSTHKLIINYSETDPSITEPDEPEQPADDYRKWDITDERWGSETLGTSRQTAMNSTAVGYGDLYVAAAKLLIQCGLYTPENMNPAILADLVRSGSTSGMFAWKALQDNTTLTSRNINEMSDSTYNSDSEASTVVEKINAGKHLFIKIDNSSSGYGWALVDETKTLSTGEIWVWLSKSTASKSTSDNPVRLKNISTTFNRVVSYQSGNSPVQVTYSGTNGATLTGSYSYCGMSDDFDSTKYVPVGASVTVNATPAAGYAYSSWSYTNISSETESILITDKTFKFNTTSSAATVTYNTAAQNGTINYSEANHFTYTSKPTSAAAGASVSFTISPDTDYLATVFVEDSSGNAVAVTKSTNTYSFTMPSGDVNVSVEMNYDDYRKWSKSDSRWAETTLGSSSNKVKGTTVGMGDLVVAVTKLAKQSGSTEVTNVSDTVTKLNSGGGLGTTGYLDWSGTVSSGIGFNAYHLFNTSGSSTGKAADIVTGIGEGKHYIIKVNNTVGWVAVDEALTKLTGEIYVMRSGDTADENADVKLADLASTFANYAYFTGGSTPSPTERTITFSNGEHIDVSASYTIGSNTYSLSSGNKVYDGMTVHFRANPHPGYEFGDWTCTGVTPDQKDTAELVVTATANVTVSCNAVQKDSPDTTVPLKIKYAYQDYDPSLSETYEYKDGVQSYNEYLVDKTVFSTHNYTIAAGDLTNAASLRAKVVEDVSNLNLNSDYFNYSYSISGTEDFTSVTAYDYSAQAYVLTVNMHFANKADVDSHIRKYSVTVNSSSAEGSPYHFQQEITLKASDYGVTDAVWEDGGNILSIDNEFKLRVTGNMSLTVREKSGTDPDSLEGRSVITYAYKTKTTVEGVEKCNQNFYIRDYIGLRDSSKTLIGAGVFYFLYDDTNNKPVKSAITKNNAVENLGAYALDLANKSTGIVTKHTYNGKETGLTYSYHNYEQDCALNPNDQILRSPAGSNYVNYILELSINNQPANADRYSYRVFSFYLYSEGGTTHAVVTNNLAAAKVFTS